MLLDVSEELPTDIFVLILVKSDSLNQLKVIPVDVTFFSLLDCLLLAPRLVLDGQVVLKDLSAPIQDGISVRNILLQFIHVFLAEFKDVFMGVY